MPIKDVDDPPSAPPQVGEALWRTAGEWRHAFGDEMARRGYPWHRGAAGELLAHVGPAGIAQAALAGRLDISKQAVQQLVDRLEAQQVVRRVADGADRRARRLELTPLGLADVAEQVRVKRAIEDAYRNKLGKVWYAALEEALRRLQV